MNKSTGGAAPPNYDQLPPAWESFLGAQLVAELGVVMGRLALAGDYYPKNNVLRAFHLCDPSALKAVVVGQDPYHGEGEANGLAFSYHGETKIPPSLKNIYKELLTDLGWPQAPKSGDLTAWAREGVLLLNAILSVKPNEAGSHASLGWEEWTSGVLRRIAQADPNVVFVLWGAKAQKKAVLLGPCALVVAGGHPSPLSANRGGFFGGRYFSKVNALRSARGLSEIDWRLDNESKA